MDYLWSTAGIPAPVRGRAWCEALSRIVPMRIEAADPATFEGEFRYRQFGPTAFVRVSSQPQWVRRGPEEIARSDSDDLFVSAMTKGTGVLHCGSRAQLVRCGSVTFVDGSQPYALEFREAFSFVSMVALRADMRRLLPEPESAHCTVLHPPAGPALGSFLAYLEDSTGDDGDSAGDENRLYNHFLGLAAAALRPSNTHFLSSDAELGVQIKAYLIGALGDDVSTDAVADRFNISRRKLQRVFQREGTTPTLWLRRQRLEHCARDLADARLARRSITLIALDWGFTDMAYFSRCFRQAFGKSPRGYRRDLMAPARPTTTRIERGPGARATGLAAK